jgi:hypothetical protein
VEREREGERRKNLRILAYMELHLGSYLFGLPGRREKKKKKIMVKSKLDENNDDEKGSSMFRRLYPSILHILFPDFFCFLSCRLLVVAQGDDG